MIANANADELSVQFDGAALKWIKIAIPLLEKNWHVDMDDSVIMVSERRGIVLVDVTTRERASNHEQFGGPGYVVEISKKDMRIVGAHYVR